MDNLKLWDLHGITDPNFTTEVSVGRTFTTIKPYYQIKQATETFGPMGIGFGLDIKKVEFVACEYKRKGEWTPATSAIVYAELWYKVPTEIVGGANSVSTYEGRIQLLNDVVIEGDQDCMKKVFTDTLTKGLSYLGFANDIFMGHWGDSKYAAAMAPKANDEVKQAFISAVTECEMMGYDKIKIDVVRKYHAERGYVAEEVEKDLAKLNRWLEKRKAVPQ